jgi:hypothetical protein
LKTKNKEKSKLCKLYFVNKTQVQQRLFLWLKLSFIRYSQKI